MKASQEKKDFIYNTFDGNIFDPGNTRYLLSTDKDEILNYWKDNYIYVAFSGPGGSSEINTSNMISAEANILVEEPSIPNNLGDLVGSLTTIDPVDYMGLTTKKFEILNKFDGGVIYYPDDELIIHIDAEYLNGELVNDYYTLTLTDESSSYKFIRLFFRGNLKNINVDIYEVE